MKGRKRTPTKILKMRGSQHAKGRESEPEPKGVPACPAKLSAAARAEWRRVAPELVRLGLLTKIDRAGLAGYCQAWALFMRASEVLEREGLTAEAERGGLKAHPAVSLWNIAMSQMHRYAVEFGFTPSSRARVSVTKPAKGKTDETRFFG